MSKTTAPALPEPEPVDYKQQFELMQQINVQLQEQIEDLSLHLEVANDRWVAQVNENASLKVEIRKLNKKENANG